jgi:hypothetical protein
MADLQAEITQYREFLDNALVELVERAQLPQIVG